MARLRYSDLATGAAGSVVDAALSGSHTNSVTTLTLNAALTYANGTAVPTITGSGYFMLSILDANGHVAEIVKVTAYTTAATSATVTRGQEGTAGVSHASGAKLRNAPTPLDFPRRAVRTSRTAGNITTSTIAAWANVDTGLDITIPAVAGDVVLIGLSVRLIPGGGIPITFDAVTVVSSSPLNSAGADAVIPASTLFEGVLSWRSSGSGDQGYGGTVPYTVQAGDIVSGDVLFRLQYRVQSGGGSGLIVAGTDNPLVFWAQNTGQA